MLKRPQDAQEATHPTSIRISTWAIRSRTEQGNDRHRRANAMQIEQSNAKLQEDRPLDPRLEDGWEGKNRYLIQVQIARVLLRALEGEE